MPPFVRDDVPLVWCGVDQDQDQYAIEELPVLEDDEFNDRAPVRALSDVRTSVEPHAAGAEPAGQNMGSIHQRFSAYFNLIMEFANAVDRKLSINMQPLTAETATEHSAINEQITRLVQEISEFYDRYMRE